MPDPNEKRQGKTYKEFMEEEIVKMQIDYIERRSGYLNKKEKVADPGFIEIAKVIARTLKAKLVKVDDNFGEGF